MMSEKDITCDITDGEWDNFVHSHPLGNIFQTRALSKVYAETKNYYPICIAVTDPKSQEILGVMSGVRIREINRFFGVFTEHSIVQGGPLIFNYTEKNTAKQLIAQYDSLVGNSSLYNEIRNMHYMQKTLDLCDDYNFIDHLNYIINLKKSQGDLWNCIHNSRRRRIKKAEKEGIFIDDISNPEKLLEFYRILRETYSRARIPLADFSLFESAYLDLVPKGLAKFFFMGRDDKYLSARALLLYKNRIYDWYAGITDDPLSGDANAYSIWHILNWGREKNYEIFDFGGAGNPNKPYGPREFKQSFGGDAVNYGRNVREYSKMKVKIANIGLKVFQRLFV